VVPFAGTEVERERPLVIWVDWGCDWVAVWVEVGGEGFGPAVELVVGGVEMPFGRSAAAGEAMVMEGVRFVWVRVLTICCGCFECCGSS
jgi:hypothetical protein